MKAYRYWNKNNPVFWVAGLKGKESVDWLYSRNYKDAIELNSYWQRRFEADCKFAGVIPKFIED
jgi:hypothetical protein